MRRVFRDDALNETILMSSGGGREELERGCGEDSLGLGRGGDVLRGIFDGMGFLAGPAARLGGGLGGVENLFETFEWGEGRVTGNLRADFL